MSADQMTVNEASERLVCAMLVEFAGDRDDSGLIPLRQMLVEVGRACGVDISDQADGIDEWVSVEEFRERTRAARQGLAEGENV